MTTSSSQSVQVWPMMEAMAIAQQPVWALFVNPVIGLIGAIVGGKLISRDS